MQRLNPWLRKVPEWAVWALGALPLALLVWDGVQGALGVDPVAMIEHRLGRTAIYLLIASLAVTPLMRLARVNVVPFRRALGLLAFSYAVLHLGAWAVFDMGLLWGQILRDIAKRPYLLFGAGALLLMLPLALTSNAASIRWLGPRWKALHRAAYAAASLAALHWLWVGKVWQAKPILWSGAILLLLALRLLPRRRAVRGDARKNRFMSA